MADTDLTIDSLPCVVTERDRGFFVAAQAAGLRYVYGFDNSFGGFGPVHIMGACFTRQYIPASFTRSNDPSLHVYHYDVTAGRWVRDVVDYYGAETPFTSQKLIRG